MIFPLKVLLFLLEFAKQGVEQHMSIPPTKWLSRLTRNASARINLVCFPYGGAGASAYKPLAMLLPADIDVWAVQLPGRENRFSEPFAQDADAAVQAISADIDRLGLNNLMFFGHSMGSDLAVLCASFRQQQKRTMPRLLVVSGNKPPHIPLQQFWASAPEPALVQHVLAFGGISPEVLANAEFAAIYLEKLRADYRLYEGIGARPPVTLETSLLVVRSDVDPLLADVDVNEWRQYSCRPFMLREVKGGHFYFQPDAGELAAVLAAAVNGQIT